MLSFTATFPQETKSSSENGMIVTFSVITWGELGDRVRGILALLEKAVQTEVAGAAYGDAVDNFHASLIAISTDLNKKELKKENRTGSQTIYLLVKK